MIEWAMLLPNMAIYYLSASSHKIIILNIVNSLILIMLRSMKNQGGFELQPKKLINNDLFVVLT